MVEGREGERGGGVSESSICNAEMLFNVQYIRHI
jgi:hypothetical protein